MTTPVYAKPEVICIASSLLQKAVFLGSTHAARPHLLIGNRGISGDITYEKSVLNSYRFLEDITSLLAKDSVELFLPHALTPVYYFAVSHPGVSRISFIDEGQLTHRFLMGGYRKPAAAYLHVYPMLFVLARRLPKYLRINTYRVLVAIIKRTVGRRYERDTVNYPRRTLELERKGGVVLSHISPSENLTWVEHVDLTRDVRVARDGFGAACLFIHPNQVDSTDRIVSICRKIAQVEDTFSRGLIKPHPLFSEYPDRLAALTEKLAELTKPWEQIAISGRYEPTIEIYARGVRIFFVGSSSVIETINSHPAYFSDLTLIKI